MSVIPFAQRNSVFGSLVRLRERLNAPMLDGLKSSPAAEYHHKSMVLRLMAARVGSPEVRLRLLTLAASFERLSQTAEQREAEAMRRLSGEAG